MGNFLTGHSPVGNFLTEEFPVENQTLSDLLDIGYKLHRDYWKLKDITLGNYLFFYSSPGNAPVENLSPGLSPVKM